MNSFYITLRNINFSPFRKISNLNQTRIWLLSKTPFNKQPKICIYMNFYLHKSMWPDYLKNQLPPC